MRYAEPAAPLPGWPRWQDVDNASWRRTRGTSYGATRSRSGVASSGSAIARTWSTAGLRMDRAARLDRAGR